MRKIYLQATQGNCLQQMQNVLYFYIVQFVLLLANIAINGYFVLTEKFCILFAYIINEKIYYMYYCTQSFQE